MLEHWQELTRIVGYVVLSPVLFYFSLTHYNSGEKRAAIVVGGLAAFLLVLMYSLVLTTYYEPTQLTKLVSTFIIAGTATAGVLAVVQYITSKRHINRQLSALDEVLRMTPRRGEDEDGKKKARRQTDQRAAPNMGIRRSLG